LKKLNKIKPVIKIKEIDNRDDGSVDISFVINNPALNLFKKVHKLKNMHKKDLYVRIGEIILKTLSDEQ
jgi:acylphosphatase